MATSAAMLSAAHAEEAVAPDDRAAGLVVSVKGLPNCRATPVVRLNNVWPVTSGVQQTQLNSYLKVKYDVRLHELNLE